MRIKPRPAGFTIVEIMIVVAIITIITSVAIPNILRMRVNANEKAAIVGIKMLQRAMDTYQELHNAYPNNLANAQQNLVNANLLPPTFSNVNFTYSGYRFNCGSSNTYFRCNATPTIQNSTGVKWFVVTSTQSIMECFRSCAGFPANYTPLQGT